MRIFAYLRRLPSALRLVVRRIRYTLISRLFEYRREYQVPKAWRKARLQLLPLEPRLVPGVVQGEVWYNPGESPASGVTATLSGGGLTAVETTVTGSGIGAFQNRCSIVLWPVTPTGRIVMHKQGKNQLQAVLAAAVGGFVVLALVWQLNYEAEGMNHLVDDVTTAPTDVDVEETGAQLELQHQRNELCFACNRKLDTDLYAGTIELSQAIDLYIQINAKRPGFLNNLRMNYYPAKTLEESVSQGFLKRWCSCNAQSLNDQDEVFMHLTAEHMRLFGH
jgi:hypothetical protein